MSAAYQKYFDSLRTLLTCHYLIQSQQDCFTESKVMIYVWNETHEIRYTK